jgi:hypothetical protein
MLNVRRTRGWVGGAVWLVAFAWCVYYFAFASGETTKRATASIAQFAAGGRQEVDLEFSESQFLEIGTPVFIVSPERGFVRVGEIRSFEIEQTDEGPLARRGMGRKVRIAMYAGAPIVGTDSEIVYHETPVSLEWVLETMLPPESREQIANELFVTFQEHQDEIVRDFRPILERGLRDISEVLIEDFQAAIAKRQDRVSLIVDRYQQEVVADELVPLVQAEIWPLIQDKVSPLAQTMGAEIWERVSLWRFGWRLAYDKTPLPRRDLTTKEFERFLQTEVMPVLEAHMPEIIQIQKELLAEISENERVREVLRESVSKITADPEIRSLVDELLQEVVVSNSRLREVISQTWNAEDTQAALRLAAQRFEPTVVRISEQLFGTPQTQITPEFARVLRNQVLRKDFSWFILHNPERAKQPPRATVRLEAQIGETGTENPFVQLHMIPLPASVIETVEPAETAPSD